MSNQEEDLEISSSPVNRDASDEVKQAFSSFDQGMSGSKSIDKLDSENTCLTLVSLVRKAVMICQDFKNKRVAKKKRMFGYEGGNQPIESVKSRYETDFFNTMIDSVISNMD
ncbi:hypothetical protein TNCV_4714951 [Trichonephila clavipes]|nr:hypothetical protein TNCV_4714951 [Trichonephila clavipes]